MSSGEAAAQSEDAPLRTKHGRPPLRVLHSLAAPDGTTRFVDQVIGGAPREVRILTFSWRRALIGRYDLFHIHWPEMLVRRSAPLTLLLLARLMLLRIPIVRTLHNLEPHEPGSRIEGLLLQLINHRTALYVRLNETSFVPNERPSVLILHGHYRDRFERFPRNQTLPGRILYFGLVRPYKGVDKLLTAFQQLDDAAATLRIVGSAAGDRATPIREAAKADPRISSRLEFVPDADLVQEVSEAELVVLPYRELHNSGAMLVATSLEKPVLVPLTSSTEAFQREVGSDWVLLYEEELQASTLQQALNEVRRQAPSAESPVLQGRDWAVLGEQTYQAYLSVTRPGRGRRSASDEAAG